MFGRRGHGPTDTPKPTALGSLPPAPAHRPAPRPASEPMATAPTAEAPTLAKRPSQPSSAPSTSMGGGMGSGLGDHGQRPRRSDVTLLRAQVDDSGADAAPVGRDHSDRILKARDQVMGDMKDAMDLSALAKMERSEARAEIKAAIDAISQYRVFNLNEAERERLVTDICDEVLGLGPLEPLLARDDIADIMVNDYKTIYIETRGKIQQAPIRFRDNQHLLNICQRIVSAVGRRVDESSPICDARLPDGSRVNCIVGPLAVDGPALTIRKFKRDKLTLEKLVEFGSVNPAAAKMLQIASHCRVNILVSGGTGSGKTTMLNCLTRYMDPGERIVTCEDACELQLQQKHVVRLETRPKNIEGAGEVTMRDLVKNCLRMRPDRIIVGEVRGPEAFDLLQAMNTGHDGSMGTVHANNPRECLSRLENMVAMGGFQIPVRAVREQIASAVGLIVQIKRLRDGSRKVTHITEVMGMEGDVVTLQDLFTLKIYGEDHTGKLAAEQVGTGIRPAFYELAKQYGLEADLIEVLEASAPDA